MEQLYPLNRQQTTIGRSDTNDLTIPADRRVGRQHAFIVQESGQHIVYDANSANGTWVNDVRVSRQVLEPGDRIRVGGTTLVFTGRALQLPASVPLPASPAASGSGLAIAAAIGAVVLVAILSSSPGSGGPYGGTPTATLSPSAGQAVATVVADMDRHLRDSGYVWQPSHNEIVDLPPEERLKRLGGLVQPPSIPTLPPGATVTPSGADGMATAIRAATQLAEATPSPEPSATIPGSTPAPPEEPPLTLDYRPFGTSVRNQGGCGSCWAHASIAVMETQLRRAIPGLGPDLDLSEQRLVSCHAGSCGGYFVHLALGFLVQEGAVEEDCNPYQAEDNPAWCPNRCPSSPPFFASDSGLAAPPRTVCSSVPDHRDEAWNTEVTEALSTDGPLVAVMSVPEDFFFYGSGIYSASDFFVDSGDPGCHAVALVGYSRPGRYWLIKNSWGSGWGEQGYARISWDDEHAHLGGRLYRLAVGSPSPTATASPTATPSATMTAVSYPGPSTITPTLLPEASATWTAPPPPASPTPSSTPAPYPRPYP